MRRKFSGPTRAVCAFRGRVKMSEEQPTFKVTDRRLFNPDGTPREVARDEEAEPKAAGAAQTTTAQTASSTSAAARQVEEERPPAPSSETESRRDEEAEDIPGANDPASFVNFVMSIASNAASALGMMEHPVTGERDVDLDLAKHWIDILGMLRQKTRNNLAAQEQQIIDGLLSDLRMQYVSLTQAPQRARGFTGRDILGGK